MSAFDKRAAGALVGDLGQAILDRYRGNPPRDQDLGLALHCVAGFFIGRAINSQTEAEQQEMRAAISALFEAGIKTGKDSA